MENIQKQAERMQETLVSYRRALHHAPEVGMSLPSTSAFVKNKLREMGYEPQEICESGIVAMVGGMKPGKVILLRADMDGLPITEEAPLSCKATNGNMHACGHDFHTTHASWRSQDTKRSRRGN